MCADDVFLINPFEQMISFIGCDLELGSSFNRNGSEKGSIAVLRYLANIHFWTSSAWFYFEFRNFISRVDSNLDVQSCQILSSSNHLLYIIFLC